MPNGSFHRYFLLCLLLAAPAGAAPQWRETGAGGVSIHYQAGQEAAAQRTLAVAREAIAHVGAELGLEAHGPISITLYPSHREFAQATGIARRQLVVGLATTDGRTAQVDASGMVADIRSVVRHEVAHLVLAQAVGGADVPLWFNEGLAERAAGRLDWDTRETLAEAAAAARLIPLKALEDTFPRDSQASVAYAQSNALVAYILEHSPAGTLPALTQRLRAGEAFDAALTTVTGRSPSAWDEEWRGHFRKGFRWYPWIAFGAGASGILMALLCVLAWRAVRRRKEQLPDW